MPDKSIIIIGGGLAGLSAGVYGQLNGYKTRIFEHHSKPGGVCAAWKRGDYLIDGCIHYLMGYKPGQGTYKMYNELGVFESNHALDMEYFISYFDETSGANLQVTSDLGKLTDDMKRISPDDSRKIDEFIAAVGMFRGLNMADTMEIAPELRGFFGNMKMMWGMRKQMKYMSGKFGKSAHEYALNFKSPFLREMLEHIFLPEVPMWFNLMLLAFLADGQLGVMMEGSMSFAVAIEKRYKSLGGEITYKATVEKILVENNRAVGVRLQDGTESKADIVISAADGNSTIYNMLDGNYISSKIDEMYNNWPLFRPIHMVTFGVKREFPGEPPVTVSTLTKPIDTGGASGNRLVTRIMNYSPNYAPPGRTVFQTMLETSWDYWSNLQSTDRAKYEAEKTRLASDILNRLETRWPGISAQVEMTDVATPYTMWRYTRNHRGAFEGFQITPRSIMARVPKILPGLSNFYMAGQWVMPGGGVPTVLYCGSHVIQIICRKDGKKFKAYV
jgi:phytoene desaturase